jgi:metal-dependent hydrolase (beta-lactamase superfamily II)
LRQLDFAVVSHRHGDHTSGLNHLLKVNPAVKIYAPQESFGVICPFARQGHLVGMVDRPMLVALS